MDERKDHENEHEQNKRSDKVEKKTVDENGNENENELKRKDEETIENDNLKIYRQENINDPQFNEFMYD